MSHTINIPDGLWDIYDGSPSAMRDTLWQAKVSSPPNVEEEEHVHPGTVINLRWSTRCSVCSRALLKGQQAVIRTRNHDGAREIVCLDHVRGLMDIDELTREVSKLIPDE